LLGIKEWSTRCILKKMVDDIGQIFLYGNLPNLLQSFISSQQNPPPHGPRKKMDH